MSESLLEIQDAAAEIEIPAEMCCNCASRERLEAVESELKLTRYFGMAGVEYTFQWLLPFCPACRATATRVPINKLHIALMIGLATLALFLAGTIAQMALDLNWFAGQDFWVALGVATLGVGGFYASRQPKGTQTSYYQPIRVRKLRQKFSTGEVTGIVLGFTNPPYMRRFRDANAAALRD